MAEDDATVAPEPIESDAAPENTETGGESSSSNSWPAEAQAEYTRKTQALAEERKSWESQRTQQTQQLQQYAQQMQQQQFTRQQQTQNAQSQQSNSTMLDQLRKMPYLDGNTAAQLMERMVNEGINPLNQALQHRDQALAKLYKDYKELRDNVGSSQGKQAEKDLDTRFVEIRESQGLPDSDVIRELMRDVYYSHEGDTLDAEYPEMLRKRWEGIQKAVRDSDRAAAKVAKESPFPSRGGQISPTSGKTGGYKTPEDRANELWPMLSPGQPE
jgi:flagellar biosynthesis GTPase FlhF